MVYIDQDGRVLNRRPWSVKYVLGVLTGLWFVLFTFFKTLMRPFMTNDSEGDNRNSRRGGWSSGGGGGNGPGGGGGGPGPNRRIGRINTSMDCNMPGGGCARL